ncbi:hypothetical protein O3P69_014493 [Scylla paramamosain]|uniref:Uncharacterized protein n=1 Tax=Scylla paramamosain TaxID=85552 RepID=A0AAW0TBU3_SCYPA
MRARVADPKAWLRSDPVPPVPSRSRSRSTTREAAGITRSPLAPVSVSALPQCLCVCVYIRSSSTRNVRVEAPRRVSIEDRLVRPAEH